MISGSAYNISAEIGRQQSLSRDIAQLQTDISSGVKLHVASDDPLAAARVAQIRGGQADNATWSTNVTAAKAVASLVDTSLSGLSTSLVRAKELMLSAANGTLDASDRAAIVTELQGIAQDVANAGLATDSSGQPLYSHGTPPLAIPIGRATSVAAGESYEAVFEGVSQADGSTGTLAGILQQAITAAGSGDGASAQTALANLDAAMTHVTDAQTDAGVRSARINAVGDRLADDAVNLTDERSGLESTDMTAAAATLSQKMTTLSAAQSVLAQLSKTTLFDKLG